MFTHRSFAADADPCNTSLSERARLARAHPSGPGAAATWCERVTPESSGADGSLGDGSRDNAGVRSRPSAAVRPGGDKAEGDGEWRPRCRCPRPVDVRGTEWHERNPAPRVAPAPVEPLRTRRDETPPTICAPQGPRPADGVGRSAPGFTSRPVGYGRCPHGVWEDHTLGAVGGEGSPAVRLGHAR